MDIREQLLTIQRDLQRENAFRQVKPLINDAPKSDINGTCSESYMSTFDIAYIERLKSILNSSNEVVEISLGK